MKASFTTLGCPDWSLDQIIANGSSYGFAAVDFRGVQDDLDITELPAFTTGMAQTRRQLADAGLAVSGISTSLRVCDETKTGDNLEEARRTIPVAAELGVPNLRVFGGGRPQGKTKAEMADIGGDTMQQVLALDGAGQFKWVFETHDEWISSTDCKLLLDRVGVEAFGALWDMGHTARVGAEDPAASLQALGDRVYYLHVKDALYEPDHPQAMKDGWRYVGCGQGQLPLALALGLLKERGYDGYVMYEWEKRWHRELPEPEVALPEFAAWFAGLGL